MKQPAEFMQFYSEKLLQVLQELELERKKALNSTGIATAVIIVLAVIILGVTLRDMPSSGDDILFFSILAAIISLSLISGAFFLFFKNYKKNFKNRVITAIVGFISPDLRYDMNGYISKSAFMDSRIFNTRVDVYNGEDYVQGMVGKTKIEFSEVHAEKIRKTSNSKNGTRYIPVFNGLFFIADFNKEFKGLTVVLPDFAEKTFGSLVGNIMQEMNIGRGELVKLADPEFQKAFAVYGDDQVEARYILSPSLMRRMLDFKNKSGYEIYLSFHRNRLHMAIPTGKDMFEPPLFRTAVNPELANEYYEDLKLAIGIVDELNLNTRIWSKE